MERINSYKWLFILGLMVRDLEDSIKIKLEDSFRRIIRLRNGNGRHVSSEEILTKGVEFFINRIFSDAKNSELTIPRRELVRALYYSGASATLQDASELCSSLAGHCPTFIVDIRGNRSIINGVYIGCVADRFAP